MKGDTRASYISAVNPVLLFQDPVHTVLVVEGNKPKTSGAACDPVLHDNRIGDVAILGKVIPQSLCIHMDDVSKAWDRHLNLNWGDLIYQQIVPKNVIAMHPFSHPWSRSW